MRTQFNDELRSLQADVVSLTSMVQKGLDRALQALARFDAPLARQVIQDDLLADAQRYRIEQSCQRLLARQSPVAHDLRFIMASLQIASELERMGDHAKDIARQALAAPERRPLSMPAEIGEMGRLCGRMLDQLSGAILAEDAAWCRAIAVQDQDVALLDAQLYRAMLAAMGRDPLAIAQAVQLMRVSQDLVRIADRATNICERVVFTCTGQLEELPALSA